MSEPNDRQTDTPRPLLDRQQLARLWPFVRPYRRQFGVALFILALSFSIELTGPWLVRQMIDGPIAAAVSGGEGGEGALDTSAVANIGLGYLALLIVGSFLGFRYAMVTAQNGQRVVHDLRMHLYAHLYRLGPAFFDRNAAGKLVTRVTSDVENLNDLISTGVLQTLFDLLKIVGIVSAMFWLDLRLALLGLLVVPALIGVSLLFRRYARDAYRDVRGRLAEQNAFSAELIGGVRTTRAFSQEAEVNARFDGLNAATREGWRRTIFWFAVFFALIELLLRCSQAGLLAIGGGSIISAGLSAGLFVQFWLYFAKLGEPIRELGEKYNVLQSAFASSERIFKILDEPEAPVEAKEPQQSPRGHAMSLRFEAVSFRYGDALPTVLDALSLDIPAGSTCAFIGPTGAGKSTILSLAARLRDPDSGSVYADGVDLRSLEIASLRRRIAFVPQDVFLFTGSVLENLRLNDHSISRERVAAAVEAVGASSFVERLGEGERRGLDAQVEERGATFSQGERQLLAMARALCHDPDLLILDEATANIDSATEAQLQRALDALFADRTVLVVAHRLSTVENADQVFVVNNGGVQQRAAGEV